MKADELECESIVLPTLGTGAAGFPVEDCAQYVREEVWDYEADTLADVRVIAYGDQEYEVPERVTSEIRGNL